MVDEKVLFINEVPLREVKEINSENTLFTLEIRVENDEKFLEQLHERFNSWYPFYSGSLDPRGKLLKSTRRI